MPQLQAPPSSSWLELSEAADLLGVHYTTLRRWADAGQVPCIRTPGGRRRFDRDELIAFLNGLRQGENQALAVTHEAARLPVVTGVKHIGVSEEPWYSRLDESQRSSMRNDGQRLMAVLMQYATRTNGGEAFLQEGRRLAASYGQACHAAGLTLVETVRAFLLVRRSIRDSVYQAGALAGSPDADTWRLYDRMNTFLDSMILATLEAFDTARQVLPPGVVGHGREKLA